MIQRELWISLVHIHGRSTRWDLDTVITTAVSRDDMLRPVGISNNHIHVRQIRLTDILNSIPVTVNIEVTGDCALCRIAKILVQITTAARQRQLTEMRQTTIWIGRVNLARWRIQDSHCVDFTRICRRQRIVACHRRASISA